MKYDVLIIGAGPGGYNAAIKASKEGLKVLLFEKDKIGGTCLNRGCIPMKSLLQSAKYLEDLNSSSLYGIDLEASFDYARINKRKDEIIETLRKGIEDSLIKNNVEIKYGKAKIINEHQVILNDEIYEGDNIVIASGSKPMLPLIDGIDKAITSDDILENEYQLPKSLIIIGGGVIGVEIANALKAFNVEITILEMADRLIPTLDKDLGLRLLMFFKKKNINVITNAKVQTIKEEDNLKAVSYLNKNDELNMIKADDVLIATGRKANIDDIVDSNFNLKINRGIVGDEIGKTNYDNIFVLGDAKDNNIQLAHVAEAQGENIIDYILNKPLTNNMNVIPNAIYTNPEIASVGLKEEELKKNNIVYQTKKYLTGANGKCLIENSESGFVKLIIVDDIIVGGQIISPHATELIGELCIAIEKKMRLNDFQKVIHPHPTISEMLWHICKE